jgi:F0F1-type ATP synthase membrane subunit c/vacuolar-type H+-ATPase subunit K
MYNRRTHLFIALSNMIALASTRRFARQTRRTMHAFVPAPVLPRSRRAAQPSAGARTVAMTAGVSRRAFGASATAALAALALGTGQRNLGVLGAQAAREDRGMEETVRRTEEMIDDGIKKDMTMAATLLRLAVG